MEPDQKKTGVEGNGPNKDNGKVEENGPFERNGIEKREGKVVKTTGKKIIETKRQLGKRKDKRKIGDTIIGDVFERNM